MVKSVPLRHIYPRKIVRDGDILKCLRFSENRGEGIATVRPYLVANRESVTDGTGQHL